MVEERDNYNGDQRDRCVVELGRGFGENLTIPYAG